MLPPILLWGLLVSFMKGSFTHPSAPVRIPFQLSENSKPCKTRQLIIITMIVIVMVIGKILMTLQSVMQIMLKKLLA